MMKYVFYVFFCSLLALLSCFSADGPTHDKINPNRLLVITVLDSSNHEIIRDGLTLIRSIRLLGGTLNSASITATIILNNNSNSWRDQDSVLAELFRLNVEIKFIRQVFQNRPKTLNKYLAFQWDSLRFDYILWLDADIVVFNDPLPYFLSHVHPGEINCVPDLYSYMRRYPKLNESNILWNSSLSALRVLEDNELVAHGACNTGVLLFDSLSLGRFMEGLSTAINDRAFDNFYGQDRFLDSLYFVYVVNSMGIEVTLWPYSMNYMAFFEVEILEDLQEDKIVFAHFLTDTEFYCEHKEACRCVYYNKFIPEDSLLVKNIQRLLPAEQCQRMSGIDPSVDNGDGNEDERVEQPADSTSKCQLKWPPQHESTVLHRANGDCMPITIEIDCSIPLDDESVTAKEILFSIASTFSFYQLVLNSSTVREKRLVGSPIRTEAIVKVDMDMDIGEPPANRADSKMYVVNMSHVIQLKLPTLHSLIQGPILLDSHISVQRIVPTETISEISTSDCFVGGRIEGSTIGMFDRSSIVLVENLLPNSETAYAKNLLLGLKQLTLESQLFFADYLNNRKRVGSIGVAVCCDTSMGVRVVDRLIRVWSGDALFLWVKQVPYNGNYQVVEQLVDHFRAICDSKDRLCILFSHRTASEESIAASLSAGSLSFVYVDVFTDYDVYLQNLISWFSKLRKSGLLAGSRLTSLRDHQYNEDIAKKDCNSVCPVCTGGEISRQFLSRSTEVVDDHSSATRRKDELRGIRRAVDTLSYLYSTVYLATYNEALWDTRDWLPAWYFHKLMN